MMDDNDHQQSDNSLIKKFTISINSPLSAEHSVQLIESVLGDLLKKIQMSKFSKSMVDNQKSNGFNRSDGELSNTKDSARSTMHNESTNCLSSESSLIKSSSIITSTPIKSTIKESDPTIIEKDYDNLRHLLHSDHLLDDSNDLFEYFCPSPTSVSSETSSLISTNSNCSKNSQLTDQLYNDDDDSNPVVQVCVRVRPMNRFECNNQLIKKVVEIDESDSTLEFKDRRNNNETRYRFKFNHLFYSKYNKSLEDNQEEIYSKIGKPFIQNLLEGSDLCYFAYGQTGSGKSYTIMGDASTRGLVFRFAKQLFEIGELNKHKDLDQMIAKLISSNENSIDVVDAQTVDSRAHQMDTTELTLLEAKRKIYEASLKYGFTDVIDSPIRESSFKKQETTSNDKIKDKILRFDENIKCYKDDHIYHEKLFASDVDELSSLDSCKSFDANEQLIEEKFDQIDKEHLNVLKSILTRYSSRGMNSKVEFVFKISFYEIYSESIYDLLEPSEERIKSKVREHPTSGPYIVDLTMRKISSIQELNKYFELGNRRRSKGSTSSNDQSSRSHAIFTIYITQTHQFESETNTSPIGQNHSSNQKTTRTTRLHSKISFVDLAGSERASTIDQLSEDRIKEGQSINKSLLTLGKVITKLAWINKCIKKRNADFDSSKNTNNPLFYVPYRDSVLTWLLKDCFNGKCKTFMIATIAPTSNHYDQTLSTLRYAHKASKIKVSFKFNQIIVSNQPPSDRLNDSKRLYIEHMIPKKKTFQTSSENNSLDRPQISFDLLSQPPEVNKKLINTSYKSSLIQKIKEIFKDII